MPMTHPPVAIDLDRRPRTWDRSPDAGGRSDPHRLEECHSCLVRKSSEGRPKGRKLQVGWRADFATRVEAIDLGFLYVPFAI